MKDDLLQTCILWLCPCTCLPLRQGSHVLCGMIHGPRKHFPCCPMTAPQVCIPQGELLASGISLELNFLVLFFTPFLHESYTPGSLTITPLRKCRAFLQAFLSLFFVQHIQYPPGKFLLSFRTQLK